MKGYGPVKTEPGHSSLIQKREATAVGVASGSNSAEVYSIASSRGTDSRKSSRGSRTSGSDRERSPRPVAALSHRGVGALCASPLADDESRGPNSPSSARAIVPPDSLSACSTGLASGPAPGLASGLAQGLDSDSSQPAPGTIRVMDVKVWQGPLPERFVSKDDVQFWEQQVHNRVQVLLSEKQEQMKWEANQLIGDFEQRAELYKSEARQLVMQGENRVKQECRQEFGSHMADASAEAIQAKQEAARLRGEMQSRADSNLQLANRAAAASSEAATARQNLEIAVSQNQEQAQRTASMESNAEQFISEMRSRQNEERAEFERIITHHAQEMSRAQYENQMLKSELESKMSEMAAIPLDGPRTSSTCITTDQMLRKVTGNYFLFVE